MMTVTVRELLKVFLKLPPDAELRVVTLPEGGLAIECIATSAEKVSAAVGISFGVADDTLTLAKK